MEYLIVQGPFSTIVPSTCRCWCLLTPNPFTPRSATPAAAFLPPSKKMIGLHTFAVTLLAQTEFPSGICIESHRRVKFPARECMDRPKYKGPVCVWFVAFVQWAWSMSGKTYEIEILNTGNHFLLSNEILKFFRNICRNCENLFDVCSLKSFIRECLILISKT